jgi:hypothetical protein
VKVKHVGRRRFVTGLRFERIGFMSLQAGGEIEEEYPPSSTWSNSNCLGHSNKSISVQLPPCRPNVGSEVVNGFASPDRIHFSGQALSNSSGLSGSKKANKSHSAAAYFWGKTEPVAHYVKLATMCSLIALISEKLNSPALAFVI